MFVWVPSGISNLETKQRHLMQHIEVWYLERTLLTVPRLQEMHVEALIMLVPAASAYFNSVISSPISQQRPCCMCVIGSSPTWHHPMEFQCHQSESSRSSVCTESGPTVMYVHSPND